MNYLLAFLLFLSIQTSNAFPPLGIIDFYGLRTVPEARLREALPYRMGDSIQIDKFKSQKHAVEQKLASIPGVEAFSDSGVLYAGQKVDTLCGNRRIRHSLSKIPARSYWQCAAARGCGESWQRF